MLPLVFFPELISADRALIRSDLSWLQYPLRTFIGQSLRSGNWPLWNPYGFGGYPLVAEGNLGVLSPFNLLFALPIPSHISLTIFALVHIGMAAVFTYVLVRSLGMGRPAASLAALSFGFGGTVTAQITNLCTMAGLAWTPLVLCLVIRAR